MMQAFVLGLSSGPACLAYCAPVLFPYLLSEGRGVRGSAWMVMLFLCGRLAGYLLFAVAAWGAGAVLSNFDAQGLVVGPSYMVLAALLAWYGFTNPKTACAAKTFSSLAGRLRDTQSLLPLSLGFLTGLNMCPPFVLAVAAAVDAHSLFGSISFFFMFFLGTSLYVLPTPFFGTFHRFSTLRLVSRLAAGVVAVYYFYLGVVKTAAGFEQARWI